MTDLRQAAQMALWALEDIFGKEKKDVGAINALRQALAHPEYQYEVVAMHENGTRTIKQTLIQKREWVELSDEEGAEIWSDAHDIDGNRLVTPKEIVRRIEAKLKEKNHG